MEKFLKSIMGGCMIGVGGSVYLACDNKYIGALLFTLGLFTICEFGLGLYTGKVGYIPFNKPGYIVEVLLTILGNFIGTAVVALLVSNMPYRETAMAVCRVKLSADYLKTFSAAILCGALMFIAVDEYKKKTNAAKYLAMLFCVPVFILAGFEHSVANMFYFALGFTDAATYGKSLVYILIAIFGNAIGGMLFAAGAAYKSKKQGE